MNRWLIRSSASRRDESLRTAGEREMVLHNRPLVPSRNGEAPLLAEQLAGVGHQD
jgi:hypothetical protein